MIMSLCESNGPEVRCGSGRCQGSARIQKATTMEDAFMSTRGPARPGRDAQRDRDDPRPGGLSAAQEGDPVHGRDRTTVAPRAGAEAARAAPQTAAVLASGEVWLHDLAQTLALSPYTLHGWRKKGWMHTRQLGGRGGPWAVWVDATELDRLRALKECPRLWNHQERLARLRTPGPRGD